MELNRGLGDREMKGSASRPRRAGRKSPLAPVPAIRPRTRVTRQVVDALLNLLRSGHYRVGDRLPSEWELVEQLSVGRSAVREAMRELATLDLVEIRPGRGTFVRTLRADLLLRPEAVGEEVDRAVILELLEVRRMVEPEAAALAADRATAHDLDRLELDLDSLITAVHAGYRPPEDLGFHMDVVRAAHNGALLRVAGAIVSFYERDQALPTELDVQEHRAILDAIRARDPKRASAEMRQHLVEQAELREHPSSASSRLSR